MTEMNDTAAFISFLCFPSEDNFNIEKRNLEEKNERLHFTEKTHKESRIKIRTFQLKEDYFSGLRNEKGKSRDPRTG